MTEGMCSLHVIKFLFRLVRWHLFLSCILCCQVHAGAQSGSPCHGVGVQKATRQMTSRPLHSDDELPDGPSPILDPSGAVLVLG